MGVRIQVYTIAHGGLDTMCKFGKTTPALCASVFANLPRSGGILGIPASYGYMARAKVEGGDF